MLRHSLATIAYRADKYLNDAPSAFGDFHAGEGFRTPAEILAHMTGLLMYIHSFTVPVDWTYAPVKEWNAACTDFNKALRELDRSLSEGAPVKDVTEEQLLQGPLADIMLHIGQLSLLRRLAGCPAEDDENYLHADINKGAER